MKKMNYWRTRVIPTMKKLFERSPTKKEVVVVEATKNFDDSKEAINKEIEEKKTELGPKVVEIYEATSAEIKALVREPKEDGLKEHSAEVHKFLEELVKIEFPGSKAACENSSNVEQVTFMFEKVCVFLPVVEKSREVDIVEEVVKTEEPAKEKEETKPEKEIEIVEEKKEDVKPASVPVPAAAEEKKEEVKPAAVPVPTAPVEEKKEEVKPAPVPVPAAVEEKKPAVEEVKKEVVAPAAPVAETPSVKAAETPVVVTPAKAPETPAAEQPKA